MTAQHDRAAIIDREALATYAPEQLGRTQAMTPEGYLLCSDVRVARTGAMLYQPDEVPEVPAEANGQMVVIMRDADVLFAPETLASFSGKDVTNNHPEKLLTPETARHHSIGTMLNPRRGEGVDAEYMIADLLIKDAATIAAVRARRKRECSLGYDADLEAVKPGLGRQTRIVGNHIAIVDKGRAGSTCAIQDKETDMAKPKRSLMDRLRKAFRDSDENEFEKALADAPDGFDEPDGDEGGVHVHIHNGTREEPAAKTEDEDPNEGRFKALEDAVAGYGARFDEIMAKLEPKAEEPKTDEPVMDEDEEEQEASREELMDAAAKAEILMPGYKAGTMDAASKRRDITSLRRDVLTRAFADSARKAPIDAVLGGADLAKAKPVQIRAIFDAASAVAKARNNAPRAPIGMIPQGPMTAAKMQEQIKARREKRGA